MRRSELGTLSVGSVGDAAVLEIAEGAFTYTDVVGETITGRNRLKLRGMIVGGCWWDPSQLN
jgi:dihydroorotase